MRNDRVAPPADGGAQARGTRDRDPSRPGLRRGDRWMFPC